jgi:3-deoxy-D-manno-octulosonic acid kinase
LALPPDKAAPPASDAPSLDEHIEGKTSVFLNPDRPCEAGLGEFFRLPEVLEHLQGRSSRLRGRATSWFWQPPWQPEPGLHVRQYAHGGALGRLTGTVFVGCGRMLDEFRTAIRARREGVPTSLPVALRIERLYGPFVHGHLVTEAIPDSRNLLEYCCDLSPGRAASAQGRVRLAAGIAEAIALMHDAGISHSDLNLKNLLVRGAPAEPEVFVIDFDKAASVGRLTLDERMANLLRLDRSILKWPESRRTVSRSDRLRVLRAYLSRYAEWRSEWRETARRYATRHRAHILTRRSR